MSVRPSLTPEQCRGARGMLDISQADLARRARLARRTVAIFERGQAIAAESASAIQRALSAAGIDFIANADGSLGVLMRRQPTPEPMFDDRRGDGEYYLTQAGIFALSAVAKARGWDYHATMAHFGFRDGAAWANRTSNCTRPVSARFRRQLEHLVAETSHVPSSTRRQAG